MSCSDAKKSSTATPTISTHFFEQEDEHDCRNQLIEKQKVVGLPYISDGKESACNAEDPGWEDSPGDGNGYPLQYSCLENSMEFLWAIVHEVAKSQTQLNGLHFFTLSGKESSCHLGRNEICFQQWLSLGCRVESITCEVLKSVDSCVPSCEILI